MNQEELNLLYAASLEFGPNWRKPLIKWAEELFPEKDSENQKAISDYIHQARRDIEDLVSSHYQAIVQHQMSGEDIHKVIRERYPWMNENNVQHGYSQGMYYAWRE